jgi:hypothetical protein
MGLIKYSMMFNNRHPYPEYVRDTLFESAAIADPRNTRFMDATIREKVRKWKSEGFSGVYLFLSGLVSATVSAINVAYEENIYLRLYHYSVITDSWIPQNISIFDGVNGYHNKLTMSEELNLALEIQRTESLGKYALTLLANYVLNYKELERKNMHTVLDWDAEKAVLKGKLTPYIPPYVEAMRIYANRLQANPSETYSDYLYRQLVQRKECNNGYGGLQGPEKYATARPLPGKHARHPVKSRKGR